MNELSNRGRRGKDDELGTLNLITPAKRREAASLVKAGIAVSLAHEAMTAAARDNPNPFVQKMTSLPRAGQQAGFSMDSRSVSHHAIATA